VRVPAWTQALGEEHRICQSITSAVEACARQVRRAGDVATAFESLMNNEYLDDFTIEQMDLGSGKALISLSLSDGLYYRVLEELTGLEIEGEEQLMRQMITLSQMKTEYEKIEDALRSANESGYGIVMPEVSDLHLEEPQIIKQAGGYGVHLRAAAQSIHMIRANIETEINPIVGTEQQSEDLVKYMMREFEEDPASIWQSNLFGKTLYELVNEGLHAKLSHMSGDSRSRISETLERIINEGSNGLICILL
jgi:stage IV sporulation protein A